MALRRLGRVLLGPTSPLLSSSTCLHGTYAPPAASIVFILSAPRRPESSCRRFQGAAGVLPTSEALARPLQSIQHGLATRSSRPGAQEVAGSQLWGVAVGLRTRLCRGFSSTGSPERNPQKPVNRVNEEIRSTSVRLVTEGGNEVVPMREALARAREVGLDLVEVAQSRDLPVVRIMNYRKVQYEQRKKMKDMKKEKVVSRRSGVQKEVQLRPHVAAHDLDVKLSQATRQMEKGYKVRFVVNLRHPNEREEGQALLDKVIERMKSFAKVLDQNVRKPHPKMIDVVMMPLPATIKQTSDAATD